jgi:t-SNARE complex subunit (syntaxin)
LSGVRTIEKTIGELGSMFSKLAGLVSIQAEQIERIDTQVRILFPARILDCAL